MDWQLWTVIGLVAAAVLYLGRQSWRTWLSRKSGCGGGCHCSKSTAAATGKNGEITLIPLEQLTLRRRTSDTP